MGTMQLCVCWPNTSNPFLMNFYAAGRSRFPLLFLFRERFDKYTTLLSLRLVIVVVCCVLHTLHLPFNAHLSDTPHKKNNRTEHDTQTNMNIYRQSSKQCSVLQLQCVMLIDKYAL